MPIYMDGELIWVDANNAFTLKYEAPALHHHLKHVKLVLTASTLQKDCALWMPCGDVFEDKTKVLYRITEFGSKFLVLNYEGIELVVPVTPQLLNQIETLMGIL